MDLNLNFKRLYRTKPCKWGENCRYRSTTCLYYHDISEKEKPSILKLSFDYFHLKLLSSTEKQKQLTLNVIKLANDFDNSRRAFLYKTKLCKYLNSVDHDKSNCTFAHDLLELRTQDLRFQRQCRINARRLECSIVRLESYSPNF